jgi:hypothetical protein
MHLDPGLSVAKLRLRGREADVCFVTSDAFAAGAPKVRRARLGGFAGGFAGRRMLMMEESGRSSVLDLEIVPRGKVWDVIAYNGERVQAVGMGITDPRDPNALLASWWSRERKASGICVYRMNPDVPNRIDPTYTSIMAEMQNHHDVLGGRAIGDTKGGFPGKYAITYEGVGGTSFGPFAWEIAKVGEAYALSWSEDGAPMMRGFGFLDADYGDALVVNYWGVGTPKGFVAPAARS